MNHDPEHPDADEEGWVSKRASGPSRSQRRREALDVLALAGALMDASDGVIARLPLEEELRDLVIDSRRITAQIARKRQMQYLAKHLRREDDETLETLRSAFAQDRDTARRDAARLHRLEHLRERLISGGDDALTGVIDELPAIDRNQLRQLVRQARIEREQQRPPKSARELFRLLREAAEAPGAGAEAGFDDDAENESIVDR